MIRRLFTTVSPNYARQATLCYKNFCHVAPPCLLAGGDSFRSTASSRCNQQRRRFSSSSAAPPVLNVAPVIFRNRFREPSVAPSHRTRLFSFRNMSEITRGTDLLADSLAFGERRKIILDSHSPTGFDVKGLIERSVAVDAAESDEEEQRFSQKSNVVHMNGSIIAFPHSCFLWKASGPKEVTLDSLAVVMLHKPAVEFLFIGCDKPLPPRALNKIKREMKENDIVVEQLNIMNAMGTFNVLNGEDRRVAVALLKEKDGY